MLLGIYLLLNLLLAVFYNHYKTRVDLKTNSNREQREQFFDQKFKEMDPEGKGYVTTTKFKEIFGEKFLSQNPQVGEFLEIVDEDNEGRILREDFQLIFSYMELVQMGSGIDEAQTYVEQEMKEVIKEKS